MFKSQTLGVDLKQVRGSELTGWLKNSGRDEFKIEKSQVPGKENGAAGN